MYWARNSSNLLEVMVKRNKQSDKVSPLKRLKFLKSPKKKQRRSQSQMTEGGLRWGIPQRSAAELLTDALNRTPPRVMTKGSRYDPPRFDPVATEAAQAKITEIDRKYEFRERPTSRPKAGTLGAEIESVAREAVEELARKSGEAISISRFDDLVSDFQTRIDIQAEARRRLSAKIAQSKMAIEDLLG
jgi:hypothetical protein